LFKEAANLTAGDSAPPLFSYLVAEAAALYLQGREFGDKASLFAAIELRKRLVEQGRVTHVDLGDALAALGEHETGTARLEEAAAQYRTALTGLTRPLERFLRARAQVKLGIALVKLGVRGSGTVPLEDAVSAYREALIVLTQDEVPLEWARTQYNLGIALELTSEHESRTARLEEAVAAYRAALTEFDKERVPVEWAMTQNKLSAALDRLGKQSR
jgi:tetratricopeptide (TPR) repeat protein